MEESTILQFKTLLANLMRARIPFLYIPSWEEERVLSVYCIIKVPSMAA